MKDVVSIIIPCHNYGNVVKKAVNAALAQTYPHIEILVIDDGSTDSITLKTLEEIKKLPLRVVHQKNKGLAGARNTGVKEAKGDYLFFLDNDDTIHPKTIEVLLNAVQQDPQAAYAYAEIYFYGTIPEFFVWKPQDYNLYNLIWANHPTLCSVIRKDAHIKVGGFSENMIYGWEDWEYWLKLSKHGFYGTVVNLPLYHYWRHGKTMAHTAQEESRSRYSINAIVKNNPEVYNAEYISKVKKKWRPIVSVVIADDDSLEEVLPSLLKQTIVDKQLIFLTDNEEKLTKLTKGSNEEIVVLKKSIHSFNDALLSAKGEFTFLLKNAVLHHKTSLEEAIWKKMFDEHAPYHFFIDYPNGKPRDIIIPDDIHTIGGLLIETKLLHFAGGLDDTLPYDKAFCDLILRLHSVNIPGIMNQNAIVVNTRNAGSDAQPSFNYYAQLYGFTPNLSPIKTLPLKSEKAAARLQAEAALADLKKDILAELSHPWYSDFRNQRLNFPSPINPITNEKTILYLVPYMVQGGAEKVDLDILDGLKKDGFRVIVVSEKTADNKWLKKYRQYSDEIFEIHTIANTYQQKIDFLEYLTISRNVSLVFIRSSAIGYHFAREMHEHIRAEVAVVDLLHAYNRFTEDWIDFSTPFDKYIDERIVITENLKKYLVDDFSIKKNRINVHYNGIDIDLFLNSIHKGSLRKRLNLAEDKKVIGFIGRLVEDKDPIKWIEVAAQLNKLNSDLHFVMAGDGEMEAEVNAKIKDLKLKNVSLLGWQDNVHEILVDFDLLLMTSRNEGFPLVIMEALCAGVQVVAPKLGGISEINKNGFSLILDVEATAVEYANSTMKLLLMNKKEKEILKEETLQYMKETFDLPVHQKRYTEKLTALIKNVNPLKRQENAMKYLALKEFMKDDYRVSENIVSYSNLQEYYLSRIYWAKKDHHNGQVVHSAQPAQTTSTVTRNDERIAEWYHKEYEVLPGWYKKSGHILKVMTRKRSFKSLFKDKLKGYDNTIGVQAWYDREYEALPLWYKRFGHIVKVFQGHRTLKSLFKKQ